MLLAIDVGNTNTVIGLFEGEELHKSWRIKTDSAETADELALKFAALLIKEPEITGISLCSTVPAVLQQYRIMVERYGPQANPAECVTLRCEEISSLVEVVRHSDAVLVAIRHAAPDLVELQMRPALQATARFGLVTLAGRTEHPALAVVRRVMQERLQDRPA